MARAAHEESKVRGIGRLPADLAPVSAARQDSLEALLTDVKAIERGLQQSQTQLELSARSAALEGDRFGR